MKLLPYPAGRRLLTPSFSSLAGSRLCLLHSLILSFPLAQPRNLEILNMPSFAWLDKNLLKQSLHTCALMPTEFLESFSSIMYLFSVLFLHTMQ